MRLRIRIVTLCALIVASTTSVWAQSPQSSPSHETVTVFGKTVIDEDALHTIIAPFVATHAAPSRKSGLLVRTAPIGVCPLVLGLPAAFNSFVTTRISAVAKSAGSPIATPGACQPNIEVLFTQDPQGVVDTLTEKTHGQILGVHFLHERPDVMRVLHPVQAWYVTGTIDDKSTSSTRVGGDGATEKAHGQVRLDNAYGQSQTTGTGSHIPPKNSSQIVNVLIIVDLNKIGGREIGPIADYIAMLALSQVRLSNGCGELPTILDLLAEQCATHPQSLTRSDMAFLKALYAADITTTGNNGRNNVEKGMAKDMGGSLSEAVTPPATAPAAP